MKKLTRDQIIKLYKYADEEGFAIPAFNYSDLWDMRAIVEAAEEENSPVILMADPPIYEIVGPSMCSAMADVMIEKSKVPVLHHLDHSAHVSKCKEAIDIGFNSIMIDASDKPIYENIEKVKQVSDYAIINNYFTEAEIGRIRGASDYETSYTGDDYLFDLDEAIRLVKNGRPDSLAIGIGNAHGFYEARPELNFKKLAEAKEAILVPLVLHGGTGIPAEDVRKAIQYGIRKVNVGTAIYSTYMNSVRKQLMEYGENQFTTDIMQYAVSQIKEVVSQWIRVCMSNDRV